MVTLSSSNAAGAHARRQPADAGGRAGRGGGGGRGGPQRLGPLKTEMAQWIAANKDKVNGKIVFVGKAAIVPVNFDPPAKRQADDS